MNIYINTSNMNNLKDNIPKPILKWVGGKTQLLDKLLPEFPTEINNYHEIFLGGGSVLLAVLYYRNQSKIKINGSIYAYDLNEPLIYVYKNIQTNHIELYEKLQEIIKEYTESGDGEINRKPTTITEAKVAKENYFYWIRTQYNKMTPAEKRTTKGSAIFIFLNKTCFRGVLRVGPNGYNVPYGHYKNPQIIDKPHLDEIHDLIQGVVFECCDFTVPLNNISPADFVYLDPPYAPETEKSFVGYTENGFDINQHKRLFEKIHGLTNINKKMILSNADVDLVRENFNNDNYIIDSVVSKRSINSKNPESKTMEVIIKNY